MFDSKKRSKGSRRSTNTTRGKTGLKSGYESNLGAEKRKAVTSAMQAFAEQANAAGIEGLRQAFAKLQQRGPHPSTLTTSTMVQNKKKCRYFDVPCIDQTRVILKPWPNVDGDFIHANWVTDELFGKKFICTQGPLDATAGDFWRMVWQENVDLIIMLCRITELGKKKCAQYWPNSVGESKTFYGITVRNEKIENDGQDVSSSKLSVCYGGETRFMTHCQWITWPDKFVPKQLIVPFTLLSSARERAQPTIIHCSAGIGRTGTMVVLELAIKTLLNGRPLSLPDVIWTIRSQRSKAVQNEEQYLYIHYLILQRLVNKGAISSTVAMKLCRDYEHYYFMRTHDVQIPLPVYVRKKMSKPKHIATALSLTDRETVEAISITPSASTPSSRRKMSYAEEKTETAIRGTRQKQIRKSKKTQAEGKEEKVDITANISAKAVTLRKTPELKSAKEGSFLNTMYAKTMRRTADDKATAIEETPANILPPARISRDDEKIDSAPTAAKIYPVLRPVQESVYIGPGGTAAQMYTLVKPDQERPESRETAAKICTLVKPITCENEREEPRKENAQPTSEIIIPDAENVEKALTKANKLVRQFLTSPSPVDELHMRFRNAQQALQDAFDQAQLAIALTFAMQRVYNKMPSSLDATKILDHPISTPSPCSPRSPRAKATDAAPTSDFILPDTASTARQFSKRESPPSNTVPLRLSPLVDLATTPLTVAAVNEKQQTGSQTEYARQVPKEEGPKEQNEQVPKEQVPKEQVIKEQVPKEQVPKEQVPKEQVPKEQVPKEQVPKETQYNKQSDKTSIYNTDLKVATPPNTDMTNKTDEEAPKTALPAPPVLETCTTVTAIPGPPVLETSVNVVSVAEQATTTNQSQPTSAKSPTTVETKTSTAKIGAVKAASTPKSENSVDDDDQDDEDSAQFVFVQSEWATAGQKKPIDEFCEPLGSESSASKSTNTAAGGANVSDGVRSATSVESKYLLRSAKSPAAK